MGALGKAMLRSPAGVIALIGDSVEARDMCTCGTFSRISARKAVKFLEQLAMPEGLDQTRQECLSLLRDSLAGGPLTYCSKDWR